MSTTAAAKTNVTMTRDFVAIAEAIKNEREPVTGPALCTRL